MSPITDYRERVYASYVHARSTPLAPTHVSGLAPLAPYLRKLIRDHFPSDKNAAIFDVGCGHGALIHFAREAGYSRVSGIDASPEQVEAAVRLGIEGVRSGDLLTELQRMPSASQDVVVAFDVLEHFSKEDILRVTDEVNRVLKSSGRWILHTPNAEGPFGARIRYSDFTHEVAFTRESIRQLLLSSGFREVSVFEDAPVPHGLTSVIRWLLWKLIRRALQAYSVVETGLGDGIFSQNLLAVAFKA